MGGMYSPMKAPRTEEDDMKDVEALLNKKSFKEMQKSKTGEELTRLIHRPTAKETAVAAKFKSKGGSQVKEYCAALTKEDCCRQSGSFISCEKVHFRRIIAPHTDMNLGDCSFLDTCRHMKACNFPQIRHEYQMKTKVLLQDGDGEQEYTYHIRRAINFSEARRIADKEFRVANQEANQEALSCCCGKWKDGRVRQTVISATFTCAATTSIDS